MCIMGAVPLYKIPRRNIARRIISALFVPVVLSVPWFGERFPIPVGLASSAQPFHSTVLHPMASSDLSAYMMSVKDSVQRTSSQRMVRKEMTISLPYFFVAHYDSKSQVLPIASAGSVLRL